MDSSIQQVTFSVDYFTTGAPPVMNQPRANIDYVGYVFIPLFLFFGVTGNVLTIIVMRSKIFKHFPSSYVLICLAFSDTVLNVLLPLNKKWVRDLLTTDIRSYTLAGCQAFFWAFRTAKMTSSWLVVLICIERFVAVCFPMRAAYLNTKRNAVIGIFLVYSVIGTYNGVWVTFADRLVNGTCFPNTKPEGLAHVTGNFLIVGLSIYSFIPCVILIVCTACIIYNLYKSRRARRSMIVNSQAYDDPTSKTTAMLLCIIVAFILLVLPITFAHLISFIMSQPLFESKEPGIVLYREVSQVLEHMNYSINFVLYVLACPSFRNQLPVVLCCFKKKEKQEKQAMQNSNESDRSNQTNRTDVSSRRSSASSLQIHHVQPIGSPLKVHATNMHSLNDSQYSKTPTNMHSQND